MAQGKCSGNVRILATVNTVNCTTCENTHVNYELLCKYQLVQEALGQLWGQVSGGTLGMAVEVVHSTDYVMAPSGPDYGG